MTKLHARALVPTVAQLLVGFLVATAAAVFLTSLWYFAPSGSNRSHVRTVFMHYSIVCYGWAFLVIFITPTVDRIGWDQKRALRSVCMLFLAGIIWSIVHYLLTNGVVRAFGLLSGQAIHGPVDSWPRFFGVIQSNLLLYTVIASICLALANERKFRERSVRASTLESQLAKAKLESLNAQLQPHFLFNSLNAIAALTQDQPKIAEAMIVKLSNLLRSTLELRNDDLHPLEDEVELARKYLAIEQLRFGERMDVNISVTRDSSKSLVPTLILQPLVENAIRHGVGCTSSKCVVSIAASQQGDRLAITINDDCDGAPHVDAISPGLGIKNCLERLTCIYGGDFEFEAKPTAPRGFQVSISVPFRQAGTSRIPS